MDVSDADFVDNDFEEIMKDLDVVDSWINDEGEDEENIDDKTTSSHEPSKNIGDLEAKNNRKMDVISKDKICKVDSVNNNRSDSKKGSRQKSISDIEDKGSGLVKKRVCSKDEINSKSATREPREKNTHDARNDGKEGHHYDKDGIYNTRDSSHGNRDGHLYFREVHENYRERYKNTDRHKPTYNYSRELLHSPGREFRRRRIERSPNHYGSNGNRRDISKTIRDIRKDKEDKESLRQLHNDLGSLTRRTRSRSPLNTQCFPDNCQIENYFEAQVLSPTLAPPGMNLGSTLFNLPHNTANSYVPTGAQSSAPIFHNGPEFPSTYNSNMGNPVMIPTGGYGTGMDSRPTLGYECYPAPYLAEPMPVMQQMYSASVAAPILAPEGTVESRPPPGSQEALDKLLADKSISLKDYLKLTTRPRANMAEFVKLHSQTVENRNELIDRCQDAVAQLTKLQLPNRFIVSHIIREPLRQSEVKYCSPLKRHPAVRYNFTTPAKNASQQNKQLLSSMLTTIGLEKMLLPDKKLIKRNNTRDAAVQTVVPLCDKCEVRKSVETCSKETSIDRLYLTKSVHTQVIEKELANSKSIFTPNDLFNGPTISLSHMTPAQILASKLSTKAETLKSQQVTNRYETDMSRGFTRRQQFCQYEQRDMYDARRIQDNFFEKRVSHNDEMYNQRHHHNQMHSQNNQLLDERPTPDEQRYNLY